MPTITVEAAWQQRPKGTLKTNEQGSRVKRIARGEGGRYTLYTEAAPKGVRVRANFPLWYEGNLEPTRERPAESQAEPSLRRPAPSRNGHAKARTTARDWVLTDKGDYAVELMQRNMIRRAFGLAEVKSLED